MVWKAGVSVWIVATAALPSGAGERQALALGSELRVGSELVYASGATEQPAWRVESLERAVTLGGRTDCVRLRLRIAPSPAAAEERAWCLNGGVIEAWRDSTQTFVALRPVLPGMKLDLARAGGGLVRYETDLARRDTVGGRVLEVVETTVTTLDAAGQAVRRLRESYSAGILSATRGVFEVPDSARAGTWRVTQEFRLVAIR